MGCSTSQAAKVESNTTIENGANEKAEEDRKYPPGEAFEVPLEDKSDSIIKKHPPKRLQRLVEAPSTQTTIEELEEKLANAEIRRNQFLADRVSTLKEKNDEILEGDEDKSDEVQNTETHSDNSQDTRVIDEENNDNISNTEIQDTQENLENHEKNN